MPAEGASGALALVLASALAGPAAAACATDKADLRSGATQLRFQVEVADDDAERARGLMARPSLPRLGAMLFVYDVPQQVSFWMKDTLIPLDMLFFDASGRLTHVHENAVPGDLTAIPGGATPVRFVLEINGGAAREFGIAPGAELRHPAIDAEEAVWGCGQD